MNELKVKVRSTENVSFRPEVNIKIKFKIQSSFSTITNICTTKKETNFVSVVFIVDSLVTYFKVILIFDQRDVQVNDLNNLRVEKKKLPYTNKMILFF